ncbi:VOC family protein [Haloarchaeobius iranensis]|uniref:Glyoxalase-like domain-containing protein n=1 Tax=Haloarchaeobius iranensis TaxID=996166 RepID=A0A1G9YXL9_9EURY|nr:VOC family protein [Haloarchaeobius iranensis]SDN13311.1 Glyoxalase-like domain-containing protein [Haloarchaeobius iranensis]
MDIRIDHVASAWADREAGVAACDAVGLPTTDGGEHADGTTEMSIVGFPDGSYLELITNTGDATPSRWPAFIAADAGPAAWCVEVDDLRAALSRALDAGLRVAGPDRDGRERPDGVAVEWETAMLGGSLGATLPFLIEDRTPRRYRVSPDPELVDSPLDGIAEVVVLTDDATGLTRSFDRLFGVPRPETVNSDRLGARIHRFAGGGVALAEPDGDRLTDRLAAFGPAPCGVLVETSDLDAATDAFSLTAPERWQDDRVAWFDHPALRDWLGVLEYAH